MFGRTISIRFPFHIVPLKNALSRFCGISSWQTQYSTHHSDGDVCISIHCERQISTLFPNWFPFYCLFPFDLHPIPLRSILHTKSGTINAEARQKKKNKREKKKFVPCFDPNGIAIKYKCHGNRTRTRKKKRRGKKETAKRHRKAHANGIN